MDRGQFLEQLALDGGGRLHGVVRALLERVERHEDGAGIGRVGEGRAGEADDVHGMRDAGIESAISVALRFTSSVRSSDAAGGSCVMMMR